MSAVEPGAGRPAALHARIAAMLRRPMAGNAGVVVLGQVVGSVLGLLTNLVAARMLGPRDFGTAALLVSFPGLVWSIAAVKSLSVTTRYLSSFRATGRLDELRGICKLGYLVDFGVAMVAFAVIAGTGWWVVPRLLGLHGGGTLLVVYAASYPLFSLGGTSTAIFTTWGRFRLQSAMQVLQKAMILAFTVALLWAGYGWPSVVLGAAAGQALIGVAMVIAATRLLRRERVGGWWGARLAAVRELRGEIASFFGWNYLHVTGTGFLQQAPLMLLGRLAGLEAAGYYRLALTLVTTGAYLETSLARVAYPQLSARWATDRRGVRDVLARWSLRAGAPAAALLLLAIPVLPFAVPLLLGPAYAGMVPGAQIMLVGGAVSAAFFWLQPFYYSAGYVADWVKGSLLWVAVVAAAGYVVAGRWGYVGMSVLTAAGDVGLAISMLWVLRRRGRRLWGPAAAPLGAEA